MVHLKKAGLMTKLVVLTLLIYMAITLLNLQSQVRAVQMEAAELESQVQAQSLENADLADAVANPDDPERIADVARDKLGLIAPGGKVFVITN